MFLQQNSRIWFSPSPWAIYSQYDEQCQCQTWVPSHEVGLSFNQRAVAYPHSILALAFHAGRLLLMQGLQLGWWPVFSVSVCHSFQYHEHRLVGVQDIVRHKLNFSMLKEMYYCHQEQGLTITLWRSSLIYSLRSLGISMGPLQPMIQPNLTHSWN